MRTTAIYQHYSLNTLDNVLNRAYVRTLAKTSTTRVPDSGEVLHVRVVTCTLCRTLVARSNKGKPNPGEPLHCLHPEQSSGSAAGHAKASPG